MSQPTPNQLAAITATGNLLVEAGAGAGKTRTLVERCLARLLDPADPFSLDEMLLVTFTEAAAAEMRKRIREALERRVEEERQRPAAAAAENALRQRLEEQLALLDAARISTLHGFCLQLVRDHFYELEIDPQVVVLDAAQSRLLAGEALDQVMQAHYAGKSPVDEAVQQLILVQGRGWDWPIRELVLKLHEHTQTLAHPARWFAEQVEAFRSPTASRWLEWLLASLGEWRTGWLETLHDVPGENAQAQRCRAALHALPPAPSRGDTMLLLAAIQAADGDWPKGKKTAFRAPLAKLFEEAAYLISVAETGQGIDPLEEDWNWVRHHLGALLELAREFATAFARTKRELGAVDFHDLEQFALRLLWDPVADQPTVVARHWREKLRLVFVDEYQDINAAQDKIIGALSRDGEAANRFLVGDVKQSIYRFRLADPRIFQRYTEAWRRAGPHSRVIPLVENFRSHEGILNFVNRVFAALMHPAVGGVAYDEEARLRFGDPEGRAAMTLAAKVCAEPRVEFHLRLTSKDDSAAEEADLDDPGLADLSRTEYEARAVALRLARLKETGFQVWDKESKAHRPVEWRDMVVLLRSPRNKAETFAQEFARQGVPLEVERGGFYETTEVSDLLNLLRLLDNPLQDVPVLAVLRSPLVGLTLDELATIRLALPRGRFWTALGRWHEIEGSRLRGAGFGRVDLFLRRFARWRQLARQGSLSRCVETVLDETHYEDWLLAQPRGEQRRANVQRLLAMTRQFDQLQRQGLFRFLRFVEAEQEAGVDPEPAAVETGNAVRLMSIHRSKGLEFPVVVLADLGGRFNFADTRGGIILDEEYGLCPQVKPPTTGQRYPSLPYWLAARRQKRELLGEELRLLYVALTRACDKLILTGTVSRATAENKWRENTAVGLRPTRILAANSCVDWLGPLMPALAGTADWLMQPEGRSLLLSWRLIESDDLAGSVQGSGLKPTTEMPDAAALTALEERLNWHYPHSDATREPAKTSVSTLRRRWEEEAGEEARPFFAFRTELKPEPGASGLSPAEIGTAHHKFLQHVELDEVGNVQTIKESAVRLAAANVLTAAEVAVLDYAALASFWTSEIGQRIRGQAPHVRRELPFTARFEPRELHRAGAIAAAGGIVANGDYVIVQGVADLVVILPEEIWLVDFKTDHLKGSDVEAKVAQYEPQIRLYALALERIYRRPVTERWLHFLNLGRSMRVEEASLAEAPSRP